MTNGGRRPGSGRKRKDSVRLEFFIPRDVYNELIRRENLTQIYRTRIAAGLLFRALHHQIGRFSAPQPGDGESGEAPTFGVLPPNSSGLTPG